MEPTVSHTGAVIATGMVLLILIGLMIWRKCQGKKEPPANRSNHHACVGCPFCSHCQACELLDMAPADMPATQQHDAAASASANDAEATHVPSCE